jgi:hypothetical protein
MLENRLITPLVLLSQCAIMVAAALIFWLLQ